MAAEIIEEQLIFMKSHELVDLEKILPSVDTPPDRRSRDREIPMILNRAETFDTFNLFRFIRHIIWNIRDRKMSLPASVWKSFFKFTNVRSFTSRGIGRIGIEVVYTATKIDAVKLKEAIYPGPVTPSMAYADFLSGIIQSLVGKNTHIEENFGLAEQIKAFITKDVILRFFAEVITSIRADDDEEYRVDTKSLKDFIIASRIWFADNEVGYLKGCTLRDGILIVKRRICSNDDVVFKADLFGLACHEYAHFLVRKTSGEYGYACQSANTYTLGTRVKTGTATASALEAGREMELKLFACQPNWNVADTALAQLFLNRAVYHNATTPILTTEDGLVPRLFDSIPFGGQVVLRGF